MARLVHQFTATSACSYLHGRMADTEYKLIAQIFPEDWEAMIERGWRRFGALYFRPVCAACMECVSLRVPVAQFQPTESQRRAFRKCGEVRVEIGMPHVDETRLRLYNAWHADRERRRGWSADFIGRDEYAAEFCFPHPCAREFAYYVRDQLIAIGVVDETPRALSSIFFFYDPAYARLSPGTASVLREIEHARSRGLKHLYLGYRVRGCPSVEYKANFRPHELLVGRPELHERPLWFSPQRAPRMS